ncbi:MAG: carboxypeptidase-like regulatory domain-containing protein [marine benthic group bacterium]|nr:carboxypeptidase-like regulatory domain-containing protein [Gemmatimonadota bacterium]
MPNRRPEPSCAGSPTRHAARSFFLVCGALAALAAKPLDAQTLRGRVLEQGTDSPIPGALLLLQSPEGEEVASAVSGESGAWVLRAPSAGEWLVRVERIGFAASTAGPFRVAVGADVAVPLEVSSAPLELPALTIEGESGGCGLDPDEGEAVWRLWDEARKALRVAEITEGSIAYLTEVTERQVDPWGTTIGREHTEMKTTAGRSPFRVPSAADLQARGYVRDSASGGLAYYGPDATVLLSDTFQESHCFHAVAGGDGQVGLAFEPAEAPLRVDIRGTLWLDAESSELRSIDFGYAGLRQRSELGIGPDASGTIIYDRIDDGGWIVREWTIRVPIDSRFYGGRNYKLYQETVGRVTSTRRIEPEDGSPRRAPSVYEHGARRDTTGS